MKIWIAATLIFIAGLGLLPDASAQMSERRARPPRKVRPPAPPPPMESESSTYSKRSGFFVSGLYSSANEVAYKGDVSLPTYRGPFSATESTAGTFGLAGGYRYLRPYGFGFDGYVAYEFPRTSKGLTGTAGPNRLNGTYEGDVSTSLLSLVANANYSIGDLFYVVAGVNFPIVFSSSTMELQGLPGYQIGVGAKVWKQFSIELDYRVLRMKGTIDVPPMNLQIEEANFPGFVLFVHYSI